MNIASAKKIIAAAFLANDTVIMEGPHGIGKSTIVVQYANENNKHCVPLFLSHMEVGDLIGMPRTVEVASEHLTTWTKPIWLQRMIDHAWPTECDITDLVFSSKEFESAVKANLSTKSGIVTREEVNVAYAKAKGLNNLYKLHLVSNQTDIMCKLSKHSVLFLDELNRAPIDVRQSALQLVLEKQIHEHELPYVAGKATMIVAAINPASDYQVDELDAALLDRFLHIEVEADHVAWLEYARAKNLNEIVRAYIAENTKDIFHHPKDGGIGATPRSWEKLSSFMDNANKIDGDILFDVIKGKIGNTLASKFLIFFNNYSKVIKMADVEKVINKEMKKSKEPETIAKAVAKLMAKQEPIQKSEMAEQFLEKYISKSGDDALPLLAYLYSMDLELLAAFIKNLKARDDQAPFIALAELDKPNNKALFRKITSLAASK